MKDCRLVYHCRCRSAERRYAWDNGEKERRRAISGALMVWCFGYGGCKIETRLSDEKSDQGWDDLFITVKSASPTVWRKGGRRRWYGFNATVSALEGMQRDEALSEDVADSSWLHEKEVWYDVVVCRRRSEEMRHRRGEREETH
jgi:hypothetical protein